MHGAGECVTVRCAAFAGMRAMRVVLQSTPLGAVVAAADDRPPSCWPAARREHLPTGRGDLPRARHVWRNHREPVRVQQTQRIGHKIGPPLPRWRARGSDLPGTDGLSVMRMLSSSERAQHDSLLGSHRHAT